MLPPSGPGHDAWRELILGYEELDAGERRRADAHLAECPSCTMLLEQLRRVESAAAHGSLPETPIGLEASSAAEADASLRSLRARLGLEGAATGAALEPGAAPEPATAREPAAPPAPAQPESPRWQEPRRRSSRANWPNLVAPLAAAAVIAIVAIVTLLRAPQPVDEAIVGSVQLERFSGQRGGDSAWQSGDAFALELDLARESVPVVVHVGPGGEIDLLHPRDPGAPPRAMPAGRVRLPEPASGIEWRLEGPPGRETFLVTAAPRDVRLEQVWRSVRAATAGGASRDVVIRAATSVLRQRIGPVRTIEIERRR